MDFSIKAYGSNLYNVNGCAYGVSAVFEYWDNDKVVRVVRVDPVSGDVIE